MIVDSITLIVELVALHVPIVLGSYIVFSLLKTPDLSIESAYVCGALAGAVTVMHMPDGFALSLPVALISAAGGGLIIGLLSSALTRFGKLPHLLSSIMVNGIFLGAYQCLLDTPQISLSHVVNPLTTWSIFPHAPELPMLVLIASLVIVGVMLFLKTQLGFCFFAYGNSPTIFSFYGISTTYVCMVGIALANMLAGISGYLVAQSNNFVDMYMGVGMVLLCITSLVLGKTVPVATALTTVYAVAGTASYFVLQQLLLRLGFNLKFFTAIQAIIVLCILLVRYSRIKKSETDQLGI